MLNWFLEPVFDKFDCIFILNTLELIYKKLNCFLEAEKFLTNWGTSTKILRVKVSCKLNPVSNPYNSPLFNHKTSYFPYVFFFNFGFKIAKYCHV